ncbi:protein-glutamate methylesterase/protein-glutamine glutaminase [Demequina litorisediminis]|uniref:protein-glutamate methylesterase/protein-glutamine glutaminase n=1 Tax=Demequina litorisediminis TaxID=1849022 RepID=UPI0024E15109|nr:chemotaxis response regulator protein-glutamate methylesterase [Demequina litorisediminis]
MRVLVVDDSVVVRRIVSDALASDPAIEVVGVAQNGSIALTKVEALKPDLITMDIEMPVMDGIETVRALRAKGVRTPIVMFSTLTSHGASSTLDALASGATDYVTKPTKVADPTEAIAVITSQLVPKIKALCAVRPLRGLGVRPAQARGPVRRPRALVIGSSTGGPEALSTLIKSLPAKLPVPALVVQHMPPLFTAQAAARLDRLGPSTVVEAREGDRLEPGTFYIAPGDFHMEIVDRGGAVRTTLHQGEQVNFCRPAIDVLFRSSVKVFGGDLLGVVLTGMGHDGREGARDLVAAGGRMIAQDEASSVVWGIPGAVATAGLAHQILPLPAIGDAVATAMAVRPPLREAQS